MSAIRLASVSLSLVGCAAGSSGSARGLPIGARQERQRNNIREGVREGDLTPGEARRLRQRSRAIAQDRRDAARDDGRLDAGERRNLKRRQNKLGNRIYRERHDDDTR